MFQASRLNLSQNYLYLEIILLLADSYYLENAICYLSHLDVP